MSIMENILAVCMPPPTTPKGSATEIKGNEMKGDVLHQTYSDGRVGMITLKDDAKEPDSFYVVTREIETETDGKKSKSTETLKKSKAGFNMTATIFNCFDDKLKEAEASGSEYAGTFSTAKDQGDGKAIRFTRTHNKDGTELFVKQELVIKDGKLDEESCKELAKEGPTKYDSADAITAALKKFME